MNRIATSIVAALAAAVPAIVDSALKGAVLLALVALVVALMRQASAAARHLAWFLGVAGLLLLPLLFAALPGWRVLPRWASFSSQPAVITRPESEARSMTAPIARQPSLAFAGAAALVHPGVDLPASPSAFS